MITKLAYKITDLLIYLAVFCLLSMMLLVGADVLLKYAVNKPIPGTTAIVAYYFMVSVVFLPLAFVERTDAAINLDMLYNALASKYQKVMLFVSYLVCSVFFGALAYQTSVDAVFYSGIGEMVEGLVNVPVWPGRIILPVSFALCVIVNLLLAFKLLFKKVL